MRRDAVWLCWLVAACGGGGEAGVPDAAGDAPRADAVVDARPLVVVTLNLRCLIDGWDARLPLLADGLRAAEADVIGVQEACAEPGGRDALEELVAALAARGAGPFATARTTTHLAWDMYDEGLAIVSRYPIAHVEVEPLPTAGIPRKLLAVRLVTDTGPLAVGVTHLDHQSAATRDAQIRAASGALDALSGAAPVVLVGDFNEAPGGGVTTALAGAGMTDAWAALHAGDAGFTFPASAPEVRIDYVWTRGDAVRPAAIERILTTPSGATFASDHLGLRAVLGAP